MIIKECPELKTSWEVDLARLPRYVRIPRSCRESEREREKPVSAQTPPSGALGGTVSSSTKDAHPGRVHCFLFKERMAHLGSEQPVGGIWVWFLEDVHFPPSQLQMMTPNELWANSWKPKCFLPVVRSVPIQDQNAHIQNWATWQENIYRTKKRRGPEAQKQRRSLSSPQKLDTLNHFHNIHISRMCITL